MIEDLAARTAAAAARLTADRATGGRPLGIRSLIASSGTERHEYRFGDDAAVDVRSISKVALAAAVGVAIDRSERLGTVELSLRTPVVELFEQAPAGLPARPAGPVFGSVTCSTAPSAMTRASCFAGTSAIATRPACWTMPSGGR